MTNIKVVYYKFYIFVNINKLNKTVNLNGGRAYVNNLQDKLKAWT